MIVDLNPTRKVVSIASAVVAGDFKKQNFARSMVPCERPSLTEVLKNLGPLPEEALFMGVAEDGLPILLNLWDPAPGPILLAADSKTGKTDFLRTLALFISLTHDPKEIQYSVITDRVHEWDDFVDDPHCIGVFSYQHQSTTNFLCALAMWIRMNRSNHQSILLLIDGFHGFTTLSHELVHHMKSIFLFGPAQKVWPIVSVDIESAPIDDEYLQYFHTHVLGRTRYGHRIPDINDSSSMFENLSTGAEFCVREGSHWIRFRICQA